MAAVSFVVDGVLGGMDAAVAELRAGHLEKEFLVEKLKPWRNSPVILEKRGLLSVAQLSASSVRYPKWQKQLDRRSVSASEPIQFT